MKHLYKIVPVCCTFAFLGLMALTGCEGGDIFDVNSPDWISEKVDSIANSKNSGSSEEEELVGQMEDVYTFGSTDYSSGFWTAFSKYYVIPDGEKWQAVVNLHINPSDNTYYKNMFLVLTSDADRSGDGYSEYGVWRYDCTNDSTTYNSQWGSYLYFQFTDCNNMMNPVDNEDALLQSMNGKVTVTVDRSDPSVFKMSLSNSSITKTYNQPYPLPNLNTDATNTNIRCFIGVEGSYVDFVSTNIEPIGGCTSSEDKNPVSMVLENVPDQVNVGTSLESVIADITATVTFEEDVTLTVTAADLNFTAIPDNLNETGTVTLVAVYNKTYNGENADTPIVASATFEVVEKIESLAITTQPTYTAYYYYTSAATESMTDRTMAFDPTGMVVTATYANGTTKEVDNSKLTFTAVPAQAGTHTVTIACSDGPTAQTTVTVAESTASTVTNSVSIVGAEDNSTAFWGAFSDDFTVASGETKAISFTNYSSLAGNWNNFVVALRQASDTSVEYGVVRSDNYGWGNGYAACMLSGGQSDWATWLADMNGAKVTVYVTNCGNGTADVQAVMQGTSGTTYIQYYLGINTVNPDDLSFMLTVDGSHLVFE